MVNKVLNAKVGAPMDFLVIAGMRLEMGCVLTRPDATPISLADVSEMYFTIRQCDYNKEIVWQLSLDDGLSIIGDDMNVINFNADVPQNILAGNYAYDLVIKNSFGFTTLLYGDGNSSFFIVQKNITNAN